jgi:hypothetical protein
LRYARLGAERGFTFDRNRALRFGASITRRDYRDPFPANVFELRADYSQKLETGARIATGLVLGRTVSDGNNRQHDRASAYLNYQPAQRLGPAKLSLTVGAGIIDYPRYNLFVPVLGGREDTSIFGALTLQFDKLDYAGFSPAVTVRARKSNSNISRFDTSELTLSIGIKSNF